MAARVGSATPVEATPPARSARRAGGVVAAAILALAAGAGPAAADVLVSPEPLGEGGARVSSVTGTLFPAAGPARDVGPIPAGATAVALRPVPSPDGRSVALQLGSQIAVVDLQGAPLRRLGITGAGRLRFDVGDDDGLRPLWWSPDGTVVHRAGLQTGSGRSVILNCVVASGVCRAAPIPRDLEIVGALGDGRALATRELPTLVDRFAIDGVGRTSWFSTPAAELRRIRRALRAPVVRELTVLEPSGRRGPTLQRERRSAAAGLTTTQEPAVGPAGALAPWVRAHTVVETRRRDGRLQARAVSDIDASGLWRITPDGRRLTLRVRTPGGTVVPDQRPDEVPRGTVLESVLAGAGSRGWLIRTRTGNDDAIPGFVDAAGVLSGATLAGRPLTPAALVAAVRPGRMRESPSFYPLGYEAANDALVVLLQSVEPGGDAALDVVRVPQGGGGPTLLRTFPVGLVPSVTAR